MQKDPAVLFYISNWLTATAELPGDATGWYLNLLLHNYDKGSLPNDVETLAKLANVSFSEFERFKQVFEQMLKQKFKENSEGRLINATTAEILQKRKQFKEKRALSGKIGYIVKVAQSLKGFDSDYVELLKQDLLKMDSEQLEEAKNKQVLKQMLKLYVNRNTNRNLDSNKEDSNNVKEPAHKLIVWLDENAPRVQSMDEPLTNEQAEKLLEDFPEREVLKETFSAMQNFKPLLRKNRSANLTVRNWLNRRTDNNSKNDSEKSTTDYSKFDDRDGESDN
jgi:hypothetical protein